MWPLILYLGKRMEGVQTVQTGVKILRKTPVQEFQASFFNFIE